MGVGYVVAVYRSDVRVNALGTEGFGIVNLTGLSVFHSEATSMTLKQRFVPISIMLAVTILAGLPQSAAAVWPYLQQTSASAQEKRARPDQPETDDSLNTRLKSGNGIRVDRPKVYDDSLLQQMLQSAEAKLAAMQVLDSSTIASRLGSVTGARQQISSLGINVMGPSIPGVTTTSNGATGSTVSTAQTTTPGTGPPTQTNTLVTNAGQPTQNVVTTQGQINPTAATAPAPTLSMPTSFSVSSSDILNEQMQLTYEIANLRLLLEGSLTDRFDISGKIVNPKVTLGFPITLEPDKRHKGAVAVVEVIVETHNSDPKANTVEAPAITALLPREKTYNVAALKDSSVSIGGGMVTQVVGVSGSFLFGRKTYYLIQDQDTLALSYNPKTYPDRKCVGFVWQFRPVLGQDYVRSGMKQTFVQIAFQKPDTTPIFGDVYVRTYWRRYDRNKAIVKELIPGSIDNDAAYAPIPSYQLVSDPVAFGVDDLEDLGSGQMLVNVRGRYLSGTSVRIGSTILSAAAGNLMYNGERIQFVASIADIATKQVSLIGRDGTELQLVMRDPAPPKNGGVPAQSNKPPKLKVVGPPLIRTVDPANSLVKIGINDGSFFINGPSDTGSTHTANEPSPIPPLVLIIGGRVFGYSDAPILRDRKSLTISAVIPTSLLIANPELQVRSLFKDESNQNRYRDTIDLVGAFGTPRGDNGDSQYLFSQAESLAVLSQEKDTTKFLLFGSRLKDLTIVQPKPVSQTSVTRAEDASTLWLIELKNDDLKTYKQLILQRKSERPFILQVPSLDPSSATGTGQGLAASERVTVGADEVAITGTGLQDLTRVTYNNIPIAFRKSTDGGKSVRLTGLSAAGVTATASVKPLTLWIKGKKLEVKLEVVTAKVETVSK
jgi:hypothetical protein